MLRVKLEMVNRSDISVLVNSVLLGSGPGEISIAGNTILTNNSAVTIDTVFSIYTAGDFTAPHWLLDEHEPGIYNVERLDLRILPRQRSGEKIQFNILINGVPVPIWKSIVYKENDPVLGEVYRPFEVVPPVSIRFEKEVYLFDQFEEQEVKVLVTSLADAVVGSVKIELRGDWHAEAVNGSFSIMKKGETQELIFKVVSPELDDVASLKLTAEVARVNAGFNCGYSVKAMDYEHIPFQTVLIPADACFMKMSFNFRPEKVVYIAGAGDDVPAALTEMGFDVKFLSVDEISDESLAGFGAVVLGIRSYNTLEKLSAKMPVLFKFVERGGNVVVQYNTTGNVKVQQPAPVRLKISRDRVTDENAEVKLLNPDHPLLNYPNKISSADFEGWVQERGLYFPNEWDTAFVPLMSCHDPGEQDLKGALLAMKHGEGYFIYTGLSFFRQLPAGVPGAYRIFANLVSGGKG